MRHLIQSVTTLVAVTVLLSHPAPGQKGGGGGGTSSHTSVTPDGGSTTVASGSTGNGVIFTVGNSSGDWESYSLTCSKNGLVTSCAPGVSSLDVAPSSSENVSVSFAVGTGPGTGTVTLTATSEIIPLCEEFECPPDEDSGYYDVTVSSPPPPPAAVISLGAYPARRVNYGMCLQACFAATYAQSTVPYISLDAPRSVTLVYNEDRTSLKPFVFADVQHYPINPDTIKLQVKVNGTFVTFLNGEQTLHFTGGVGSQYHRIGGQFDASSYATEDYSLDLIVTSIYNEPSGGYAAGTVSSSVSTVLVSLDERNAPVARGWTIAGWQRAYPLSGGAVLIAEGDGSFTHFVKEGTAFVSPVGDFSNLLDGGSSGYTRLYQDLTGVVFNSAGQMTKIKDRFGDSTMFTYDGSGRPWKVTDPQGLVTELGYGSYGLSYIKDPFGRYTYVTVASNRRLTAIQDPDGISTAFAYDGSLRLQTITDRRGKATTFSYDPQSGKLKSVAAPAVYVSGVGTASPTTWFEPWQKDGIPYSSTNGAPLAPVIWDSIDAFVRTPDSVRTRYRRIDVHGQPNFVHRPYGLVDTTYYNGNGQPIDVRTPGGLRATFTYSTSGYMTQSVVDGLTINRLYSGGWPWPDSIWGNVTPQRRFLHLGNGRVDSVRLASDPALLTKYTYDARGRLLTAVDPEAHLMGRTWYAGTNGNRSKDSLPGGRVAVYQYDAYGRDSTVTQTGAPTRRVVHDVLNRPVTFYDGVNANPTSFAYDSIHLRSVTDPAGQAYQVVRDALGRVIRQIDPAGRADTIEYGWMGEVRRQVNRRGQAMTFAYDSLSRPTLRQGTNFTSDTLSYSPNGRIVIGASETSIETSYLNKRGQVDSVKTVFRSDPSKTFWRRYGYDTLARLTSVSSAGSSLSFYSRSYSWNGNNTLASLSLGLTTTTLAYNNDRRRVTTQLPGTAHTIGQEFTSVHGVTERTSVAMSDLYHYDSHRRIDVNHTAAEKQTAYTYDDLSRLKNVLFTTAQGGETCSNQPDNGWWCEGEFFADSGRAYTYDAVGNRTDRGGTYDVGNRITAFDACSYSYDYDGNVTQRSCSGQTATFSWNALNQLTSYTVDGATVNLRYDAFGRLVRQWGSPVAEQRFLWSHGHLYAAVSADLASIVAQYSYYPGVDRPHATVAGTTQYFAHQDGLGNVRALTTSDKVVRRSYVYDDWGQLKGGSDNVGFAGKDRARFKGAMWVGDAGVELYYMRNRWYEPKTGRFLSEDPIGLAGGINPYAFGGGDPVNLRDPTGTEAGNAAGDTTEADWRNICPLGGIYNFDTGDCRDIDDNTYASHETRDLLREAERYGYTVLYTHNGGHIVVIIPFSGFDSRFKNLQDNIEAWGRSIRGHNLSGTWELRGVQSTLGIGIGVYTLADGRYRGFAATGFLSAWPIPFWSDKPFTAWVRGSIRFTPPIFGPWWK